MDHLDVLDQLFKKWEEYEINVRFLFMKDELDFHCGRIGCEKLINNDRIIGIIRNKQTPRNFFKINNFLDFSHHYRVLFKDFGSLNTIGTFIVNIKQIMNYRYTKDKILNYL